MRILWLNEGFPNYRVPVLAELDQLIKGNLVAIYSKAHTPNRVVRKLKDSLGVRAIGLTGGRSFIIGKETEWANKSLRIPYQRRLLKEVLSRKADVLVGEGFFRWTPPLVIKKYLQGIRLVLNYERTAHTERNCPYWRTTYRKLVLRCVDTMVCNGSLCAEYTADLGMPRDRIIIGGMAADGDTLRSKCEKISDSEREYMRDRFGLKRPVFLYVGRIIELKGIAELLRGWEIYKNQKSSQGSLLLAGDGDQRDLLGRWAEKRQLQDVHFAGWVDYDDIVQFYALADVFIIASLEDNWSLVVPEAMACGLPVACSKYNGCWPELIKTDENGVVFDPHKPQEVVNALKFFSDQQGALKCMGKCSQDIAREFSPRRAALAILKACELALSSGVRK